MGIFSKNKKIIGYKLCGITTFNIKKEQINSFIVRLRELFGPIRLNYIIKNDEFILYTDVPDNKQLNDYFNKRGSGLIEDHILYSDETLLLDILLDNGFVNKVEQEHPSTLIPNWEDNVKIKNIRGIKYR